MYLKPNWKVKALTFAMILSTIIIGANQESDSQTPPISEEAQLGLVLNELAIRTNDALIANDPNQTRISNQSIFGNYMQVVTICQQNGLHSNACAHLVNNYLKTLEHLEKMGSYI